MKSLTLAGLLAAASLALALPAHAHPRGPGHEAGGPGMFRHLQLTAEQREQVSKIFKQQEGAFKQRFEADRAAHQALRKAATDPSADIRPLAEAAGKAHAEVAVLRAEIIRKVIPLLTPEQRAKLEQAPEHRGRHGRRLTLDPRFRGDDKSAGMTKAVPLDWPVC
jgi:Spy/CpxP family protein refolding chaperone